MSATTQYLQRAPRHLSSKVLVVVLPEVVPQLLTASAIHSGHCLHGLSHRLQGTAGTRQWARRGSRLGANGSAPAPLFVPGFRCRCRLELRTCRGLSSILAVKFPTLPGVPCLALSPPVLFRAQPRVPSRRSRELIPSLAPRPLLPAWFPSIGKLFASLSSSKTDAGIAVIAPVWAGELRTPTSKYDRSIQPLRQKFNSFE